MIRDLIKNLIRDPRFPELYSDKYICGCLYRSFNELQANLFFRLITTEQKSLPYQELKQTFHKQSRQKLKKNLNEFVELKLLNQRGSSIELSKQFAKNCEKYVMEPQVIKPINSKDYPIGKLERITQPSPNSFLKLLFQQNKIPKKCDFQPLGRNAYETRKLTRSQFYYIKSSISTKIGLLISGILKEGNQFENIKSIVKLNLLSPHHFYRAKDLRCAENVLVALQKINLIKRTGPHRQFLEISKYLYHYTFEENAHQSNQFAYEDSANTIEISKDHFGKHYCNIQIIIETNFKVYTTVESNSNEQREILRKILEYLLKINHESTQFQEMIIGEIERETLNQKIFAQKISASEYFDFFKQYMKKDEGMNINAKKESTEETMNRELGKWKKLKFLGLDGPDNDSMIPSNVRQQVKLWQKEREDDRYGSQYMEEQGMDDR